ncbi:biopolymer transporter ExbD [Limnobacter thiooxidans]
MMAFSTQSDNDEVLSEINVTPLVDVMLVLLVVFIITAPLLTNAVQINLPKTATTAPAETPKPVTLSIDAEGQYFLDKVQIEGDDLEVILGGIKAANPDLTLHLQSDENVRYALVANAMVAIERSGITKVAVMTKTR